jgi:hypothetical protein
MCHSIVSYVSMCFNVNKNNARELFLDPALLFT